MSDPQTTETAQSRTDDPPRWVRVWWPPASRLAMFVIGAFMALRDGSSEAQIVGGSGLMLAAAGFAAAKWIAQKQTQ